MASCLTTTSSRPTGRLPIYFGISRLAQAGRASDTKAADAAHFSPDPALPMQGA